MRKLLFTALFVLTSATLSRGAIIHAASPAQSAVITAINSASDGDTVVVPAGTAIWTAVLVLTKGITLQGATVVSGAGTSSPSVNPSGGQTIIRDNTPLNTNESTLILVSITPSQSCRITGFTFTFGGRMTFNDVGAVHLTSASAASAVTNMRVDHCFFDRIYGRMTQIDGWVYGVIDHNWIRCSDSSQSFYCNMANFGNQLGGHGSWNASPYFGSNNFFFLEDNTIQGVDRNTLGPPAVPTVGAIDAEYGGRFVIRHNYFSNARPGWHGTEGANRGFRCGEIYDNVFHWDIAGTASCRSGNALVHDNRWTGVQPSNMAHHNIILYREESGVTVDIPAKPAANSPWDLDDTEGDGRNVDGHPPYLYDSGTVTSATAPTPAGGTITVTGKTWTTNQWAPNDGSCYMLVQTTPSAPSYLKTGAIIANTANQIAFISYLSGDRGPTFQFSAGNTYSIYHVLSAIDQTGRGKGDLVSGNMIWINTVTGSQHWPHQVVEPSYSWNNVYTPTNAAVGFLSSASRTIKANRDYYNLGTGFPADSTPSQVSSMYNATLNGGTAYTRTYQYPHPLVGGNLH